MWDTHATDSTILYLQYNTNDTATCVTYITNYICHKQIKQTKQTHKNREQKQKQKGGCTSHTKIFSLLVHFSFKNFEY